MPLPLSSFHATSKQIATLGTAARDADQPRHPTLHPDVVEIVTAFPTIAERVALWITFTDAWDIRDAELFIASDLGARIAA